MTANDEKRIKVLPPEEARRIAAGEVIDRPAALVREFLDNSIDAQSANIEISIEEGGCRKIEAADDGSGMDRENLELCYLTHATSKIRSLDDLETSLTLGFRGEALAAAAAVSRLEIITSADGREAWSLETGPGDSYPVKFEQTRRTKGTTVRAHNLFDSIPARKKFLKREGSEAALCRQVFIDKALAFPGINFRFIQDGILKDFLQSVSTKKERFASAVLKTGEDIFLHEINVTGSGFHASIVISSPEIYRNDRRQLFVFANGRRVQDYSLIQAMEYGTQGWFPNGTHPIGAVYIEIDPSLADFNIHPAKREVRFRDPGAIHHAVSGGIKSFFHSKAVAGYNCKDESNGDKSQNKETGDIFSESEKPRKYEFEFSYNRDKQNREYEEKTPEKNYASFEPRRLREIFNENSTSVNEPAPVYGNMRYAGRVFSLFVLIEWGDKLYIIDQHAAHERILYNRFLEQPIPKQELLAPIPFSTESGDEDTFLETKKDELNRLGINIEKDENFWRIEALPSGWKMGDAATVKEILELRTAGDNIAEHWAASLCCRAAIKDGDYPDDETAFALAREALMLPVPRCPHGRPVWTEISREALFKAVRRV